jgi:hypothetical protein
MGVKRAAHLVSSLVIFLGISACKSARDGNSDCGNQGDHFIDVVSGPPCRVSDECVRIKDGKNRITWESPVTTKLTITFQDPAVFPYLRCAGNHCFSGRSAKPIGGLFPYDCTVESAGGEKKSSDPNVMIDP